MTIVEAMESVARQIDGHLQERWDRLYLRLIEDGIDPENSWIFDEQQRLDREWRASALADIRQRLVMH